MLKRFISLIVVALMAIPAFADGRVIPASKLPKASQAFIAEHFPDNKILQAEKEEGEYEVYLSGSVKLEFDHSGQWKKVDCEHSQFEIPAAIIPVKIAEFVASEYPDGVITSISKDRRKYDVEIDDHIDLEFDLKGNFLRYDD